jgi:hypothetical protein
MPTSLSQNLSVFIIAFLPSFTLASGGQGGGESSGSSLGHGAIFGLKDINTATMALSAIFALVTFIQSVCAFRNIRRRLSEDPPSITMPEYDVGAIFRASLFILTLVLLADYVLHAIYVVSTTRTPPIVPITRSFITGHNFVSFFEDVPLFLMLFALISRREQVHFAQSGVGGGMKTVVDGVLVCIILGLGMAMVGTVATQSASVTLVNNIHRAYAAVLIVASLDVAISSIMLCSRVRGRSSLDDHDVRYHGRKIGPGN